MSDTFVKPPFYLSAKYLNDVNDALQGGQLTSMPTGFQQFQQNVPGDRIILDDTTAYALSDTTVGTLYGGIYMYVNTLSSSTASPAVGSIAFFTGASVGSTAASGGPSVQYQVTADAQATTTLPAMIAGIFINAVTKGNLGWIQVAGVAGVLFDSTVSSTVLGSLVVAKASASVASTADNTTVTNPTAAVVAAVIGVSLTTVTTSTVVKVAITRGISRI
jgi:hypothetical protein